MTFIGTRARTSEVLQRRMYQSEISRWLVQAEEQDELAEHNR
jgi:hypothetical protein